jgi:hypothetical protein
LQSKRLADLDIKLLEGDVRKEMFQAEIDPEQIFEIAKVLASLDAGADVIKLEKMLGIQTDEMERLVNASQILGITKIHDGLIRLSERGRELNGLPRNKKKQLLTERLSLVEPFRTAIETASKHESFTSNKVS